MKILRWKRLAHVVALLALSCAGQNGLGQTQAGGTAAVDPTLMKLFADVPAFSARAVARVFDFNQNELLATPMRFSKLGDKVRVEVDLAEIRGKPGLVPDAARMKELGLDRVISITRPDKRRMYLVYPGKRAYVAIELPKEQADVASKTQIHAVEMGREMLDGFQCIKMRAIVTDPTGRSREVWVWKAVELNEFPIQIQTTEFTTIVQVRYSEVQLTKPEAKQFEPPAGFTRFDDLQELIEGKARPAAKSQPSK
ncbi:MAG: hypothetical protein N2379_06165 [Verrucomicrobiae bacterium]|nr:hypothetical protein [Verrucomicrobiae bacterium]